jgi:DNA-binding response OmpR family regulator
MSLISLVVDSDPVQLAATVLVVRSLGYVAITAGSFEEARKHLLATEALDLLIADIRLGPFNGLQLAFRARALHPSVRVIVTDRTFDPTLEAETTRVGGAYLARPFTPEDLATLISRPVNGTAVQSKPIRRWPRRPVMGAVAAAIGAREARLLDVSYGGLCLEFARNDSDGTLPSTLDVEVSGTGLSLTVVPVWARPGDPAVWRCGAEVIASDRASETQWRNFVDACVNG